MSPTTASPVTDEPEISEAPADLEQNDVLIDRRSLLKLLGTAAGAAGLGRCKRLWLLPEDRVAMAMRGPGIVSQKQTVCSLCEGSCGVTVRLVDGLPIGLKGNPKHPLNRGGLCPVGQAGLELLYSPSRLREPQKRNATGGMDAVSWDAALKEISDRLASLRESGRGDRIALLSGEPSQLFTELGQRFLEAFGSPNMGRWSDSTLHFELTQGIGQPPGLDYPSTDLVVSFGLDVFEDGPAPLHAISSLVGQRETESRARLIYAGSRLSPTASRADERLTIQPGTHGALALGLAHVLVREGNYDRDFVAEHTLGFEDRTDADGHRLPGFRRLLLERFYPDRVADICGCDARSILRVAERIGEARAPLAIAGGEALQASNATWTGIAVHSLNALLGSFDRPGGIRLVPPLPVGPLEPLPVPMGANRVFGAREGLDRLDPVTALSDAATEGGPEVEVLFIVGCNPVHESPLGEALRQALERIPLVVTISSFVDDTAKASDFVLPSPNYLEAWHDATNPAGVPVGSLSVSDPVIEPLFDTRSAPDILLDLAQRQGDPVTTALPWQDYPAYLRSRIQGLLTSGQGSVISGSFEESWVHYLEERGWRFLDHGDLESFWSDLVREGGWWNPVVATGAWERLLPTPSGRFEFLSSALQGVPSLAEPGDDGSENLLPHFEPARIDGDGELVLLPFRPITARGRDAAMSPMILEMFGYPLLSDWETWAELSPETAEELRVHDGDRVALETERGSIEVVARIRPGTAPGTVHTPLGLGRRDGLGQAEGVGSNPLEILPDIRDSLSGAPSLVSTRVHVRLVRRREHGGPAPLHGVH